jgi:hypothetical protein
VGPIVAALICLACAASASAGQWVQVSCVNPNGSASNGEGWTSAVAGPYATGATAVTVCSTGSPLSAQLSYIFGTPPSFGSTSTITYTPPAGSSLAGGSADVSLAAYASGTSSAPAYSFAQVASPATNTLKVCADGQCDGNGQFSGTVDLPADTGGVFIAEVGCSDLVQTTDACSEGEQDNEYAEAEVVSADFLLSTEAAPQASNFSGSVLQPRASGTASLVFDATDPAGASTDAPSGPGIYRVTVLVDGTPVWSATPNDNSGACVPVGTDPASGALMFDQQQPCPPSETVDVPVPTATLADGRHRLTVSVEDAAGNSATVLDQEISTLNPQLTPAPRGGRAVRARFTISWSWRGARTTLRSIAARRLPAHASASVRCAGPRCPRLPGAAAGARAVKRLLRRLAGRRFRDGDRLTITVAAPGLRTERVILGIRRNAKPTARLR